MRDRRKFRRGGGTTDRRKYPRSDGLVLINYKIDNLQLEGKSSAYDVSGTGARITLEKKLEIGTIVEMVIYLPGDSKSIPALGDVVWSHRVAQAEHMFYASIKFTVITTKNRTRIIEYVDRKFQRYGQRDR